MGKALEMLSVEFLRCLIFGPSGYGKTWLYSLMAFTDEFLPMEIADFDNGTITLKSSLQELSSEAWDKIDIRLYRDINSPGQAHRDFLERLREINRKLTLGEANAPKTIILDSLSFMGKDILDGVATDDKQPFAKRDHYGPQMQYVEKTIQIATSLKCHTIVVGHDDLEKDELTGTKFKSIDVTGKLVNRVPRYFNEVYYLGMGANEYGVSQRYIQTVSDETTRGPKTAFPGVIRPKEPVSADLWVKLAKALNVQVRLVKSALAEKPSDWVA